MNKYRSHNCSELTDKDSGKLVSISGWLHRKRDHGNLLFIDLRDHYGLTQCVIENNNKCFKILESLRSESVIKVYGKVKDRDLGTENKDLKTFDCSCFDGIYVTGGIDENYLTKLESLRSDNIKNTDASITTSQLDFSFSLPENEEGELA